MTDENASTSQGTDDVPPPSSGKTFLCVVDDTPEFEKALYFACRRAANTNGRVALVYVTQPAEFQHWAAIGERMREEAREEAEAMLSVVAQRVQATLGQMPALYIREGTVREEVVKLIDEVEGISFLVLGAASGTDGPGPLVSYLMQRMSTLHVPVVIVPGNLAQEEIDAVT